MDLYSRRIVGWSFHSKLEVSIAAQARTLAINQRKATHGLLEHSDRGTQFMSAAFQQKLTDNKFVQSMSLKGHC